MPFLRYARDRRGYEHVYLVQPLGRRGKVQPRILYWYRTPPGIKVGRDPFDDEVRRAIEAEYPDIEFDWPKLLATPKPPPQADVERWRERRRQAKAERAAAASGQGDVAQLGQTEEPELADEPVDPIEGGDIEPFENAPVDATAAEQGGDNATATTLESVDIAPSDELSRSVDTASPVGPERKRRRRRRRRSPAGGEAARQLEQGAVGGGVVVERADDSAPDAATGDTAHIDSAFEDQPIRRTEE